MLAGCVCCPSIFTLVSCGNGAVSLLVLPVMLLVSVLICWCVRWCGRLLVLMFACWLVDLFASLCVGLLARLFVCSFGLLGCRLICGFVGVLVCWIC